MKKYRLQTDNIRNKRQKHSVLVIDDHPIVRKGLIYLINREPDFKASRDAGNMPQALKAIAKSRPDIIIIGVSPCHVGGIGLIRQIFHTYPEISILVFSTHNESIYAERCLKAGARGYIVKSEPSCNVISALRKILDGEIYISDALGTKILHKFISRRARASGSPVEILSNRELEVFQLVGQGLKTKKIAEELHLSVKTIETYIDHIKKKMNYDNSRNLFLHAVQWTLSESAY